MGFYENLEMEFKNKIFEYTMEKYGSKCKLPIVPFEAISYYIHERQKRTLDGFVGIYGDNGVGKSMCGLMLMKNIKRMNDANYNIHDTNNILYADSAHREFITAVNKNKKDCIMIDEAGTIFGSKDHMTTEQKVSYSFIEVARENSNAMIFCSKDFYTTNYDLRNGKIGIAIQLWERMENWPDAKAVGYVFLANNIVRGDDKFCFEQLAFTRGFEEWRVVAESLPTFVGLLMVPDVSTVLTDEEISIYKKQKEINIKKRFEKNMLKLTMKEAYEDNKMKRMEQLSNRPVKEEKAPPTGLSSMEIEQRELDLREYNKIHKPWLVK